MVQISEKFNDCTERWNIMTTPTESLAKFFDNHPTAHKIALFINHVFRAMVGLMFIPFVPMYISMPICFVGSVFYRLTVEKNCAYKFALPAFGGALAIMLAIPAIGAFINGTALSSGLSGFLSCASLLPIPLYITYVVLTVNYDVNKRQRELKAQEVPADEACHCQV